MSRITRKSVAVLAIVVAGCGEPAVEPENETRPLVPKPNREGRDHPDRASSHAFPRGPTECSAAYHNLEYATDPERSFRSRARDE